LYRHYENGRLHGRWFNWGRDGRLHSIEMFDNGEFTKYDTGELHKHPAYARAQELAADIESPPAQLTETQDLGDAQQGTTCLPVKQQPDTQ